MALPSDRLSADEVDDSAGGRVDSGRLEAARCKSTMITTIDRPILVYPSIFLS